MIAVDILLDGLFAAVAAIGFGAISDPPMRAFPRIALLAAAGIAHLTGPEVPATPRGHLSPRPGET